MMLGKFHYLILILVLIGCSSKHDQKADSKSQPAEQLPAGNAENGKLLYAPCKACHGEVAEGNLQFGAPALANLEGYYLSRQLTNFQKGIRGNLPHDTLGMQMAAMAKILKDSIAVQDVVAYIETMPDAELPALIKGDISKGERAYQSVCGSCHGQAAKGNEKMNAPRLNGLDDWYLKHQIHQFKNSTRGAHPADTYGSQMTSMVTLLTNEQAIDDVIAYIRSTTQPVK